jgi:hypothetical protein
MPDFRVINGGGKGRESGHYEADRARHYMDTLIIEVLRAVACGEDHENRVGRTLIELVRHMSEERGTPVYEITGGPIASAHQSIRGDRGDYQVEITEIVLAGLRVAAESCTTDNLAAGRKSKAKTRLDDRIKEHILRRELRKAEWLELSGGIDCGQFPESLPRHRQGSSATRVDRPRAATDAPA